MKIKSAIIVVTTFLGVFASIALLGGVLQKAQDAGVSASDAGFVPSIGQINLGYTSKVPSNSLAREIPSGPDARAASEVEVIAPIGASPQTMPAKFSHTNDTLDRVPIMAWPLGLSDLQRQRIYLAVMADKNAPATDTDDLGRASELPTEVALKRNYISINVENNAGLL